MGDNNALEGHPTPKRTRLPGALLPVAGLVIALVGMLIPWINRNTYISWFSYAPLSSLPIADTQ
ncbi:hypothetical protein [Pseudarthrobacter sp. NamB4]|uniref:hypothetical protein n=1 Tax=Pseudarthrobacter sp. NamB4 TaxID=2576837 RepID=UPI0010FD4A5A|nr:hypothetical protein [Pseudarthrobacter sp. NamB4]TLM72273.1 hypothetical protein FDW81_14335 [Pseudarthrobacter sp. NamB4]